MWRCPPGAAEEMGAATSVVAFGRGANEGTAPPHRGLRGTLLALLPSEPAQVPVRGGPRRAEGALRSPAGRGAERPVMGGRVGSGMEEGALPPGLMFWAGVWGGCW